jgi:general L-amino acid transport system substrate-binding protein
MMTAKTLLAGLAGLLAGVLAALPGQALAQGSGSPTLDAIRARGALLCGVSGEIAGFSLADSRGVVQGMDADYCRAIAAATLGDANKVRFIHLSAQTRFTALQSGEIDVLIRNTGWSLTRESALGLLFGATNFWDGTGFIVRASAGVSKPAELGGAAICIRPGTSTELEVADFFRSRQIAFTPVMIAGVNEIQDAFLAGRCDAFATDASQLAGFRQNLGARAAEFTILPESISSAPSGSMVRKGDDKWYDIVRWTHYALLTAEQFDVTSKNLDEAAKRDSPDIRRLLGVEGNIGQTMGLDNAWARNAIAQVGNYAELWARHMTPIGLERGINRLWTQGGLQFSPPVR